MASFLPYIEILGCKVPAARVREGCVVLLSHQEVMEEFRRLANPGASLPEEVVRFGRLYDEAVEAWKEEQEALQELTATRLGMGWFDEFYRNTYAAYGTVTRANGIDGLREAVHDGPLTEEQHIRALEAADQRMKEIEAENERRRQEIEKRRLEAEKRAGELLKSTLPEEVYRLYKQIGCVQISTERWLYQIRESSKTCIFDRKTDKLACTACFELRGEGGSPQKDRMLAEYLLIKGDEMRYLMTANITWVDGGDCEVRQGIHGQGWAEMRAIERIRMQQARQPFAFTPQFYPWTTPADIPIDNDE